MVTTVFETLHHTEGNTNSNSKAKFNEGRVAMIKFATTKFSNADENMSNYYNEIKSMRHNAKINNGTRKTSLIRQKHEIIQDS